MNRRVASISSLLLAVTTFVMGSILPALHRHDATMCCTRLPDESNNHEHESARQTNYDWCHDHVHAHVAHSVHHIAAACDDQSNVGMQSGDELRVPLSNDAFTSGDNDHDANDCSVCRFLGQQRVTLTDAVVISSANLDEQLAILANAAPAVRTLLVVRSRGPPVAS